MTDQELWLILIAGSAVTAVLTATLIVTIHLLRQRRRAKTVNQNLNKLK